MNSSKKKRKQSPGSNQMSQTLILATFAWENYSQVGRGVVIIDSNYKNNPTFSYCESSLLKSQNLLDSEYTLFLDTYNPETTIIVATLQGREGKINSLNVKEKTGLTCPQIYEKMQKRRLNNLRPHR